MRVSVLLHITRFFRPYLSDDPLICGSIGAGLVLVPGLTCEVEVVEERPSEAKNTIIFNDDIVSIPPIELILRVSKNGGQ